MLDEDEYGKEVGGKVLLVIGWFADELLLLPLLLLLLDGC